MDPARLKPAPFPASVIVVAVTGKAGLAVGLDLLLSERGTAFVAAFQQQASLTKQHLDLVQRSCLGASAGDEVVDASSTNGAEDLLGKSREWIGRSVAHGWPPSRR